MLINAKLRGLELREGLLLLLKEFPDLFSEVRGYGLLQGLAIKEETEISSQELVESAINHHLLIASAGDKVLRFVPPLNINSKEIKKLLIS